MAAGHPHQAADLWTSIVDLPVPLAPPRLRAESLLRLVVLETGRKDWTAVERYSGVVERTRDEGGTDPCVARVARPDAAKGGGNLRTRPRERLPR